MEGGPVLIVGIGGSGKSHRAAELVGTDPTRAVAVKGTPPDATRALGPFGALIVDADRPGESLQANLGGRALLVEDVHHLDTPAIAVIDELVSRKATVVVTMRPSARPELQQLRDRFLAVGDVVETGPLDLDEMAAVCAAATGTAIDTQAAADIHDRTGGLRRWALALVSGDENAPAAEVRRELERCSEQAADLARTLALAADLPDAVTAAGADLEVEALAGLYSELHHAGLLDAAGERLWPVVVEQVTTALPGPDGRSIHRRVAAALQTRGGESLDCAEHLRAAGEQDAEATEVYVKAGDELRFRDPEAALAWYEAAAESGAGDARVVVGVMEATLFGGRTPASPEATADWTDELNGRAAAVEAAAAARAGRLARCAEILHSLVGHPSIGPAAARRLAAPGRLASGSPDPEHLDDDATAGPGWVARLADATLTAAASGEVVPAPFVEACEAFERWEPTFVPPDPPHAVAALTLLGATDLVATAALLERGARAEAGGPGFAVRHRLLLAWTHLRQARYELPLEVLEQTDIDALPGRDRLAAVALDAGIARRSGDVPRMRQAWSRAEDVLITGGGDLLHQELLGELVLAAVRLRDADRAAPLLGAMRSWVSAIDGPHPWRVPHHWLELQVGLEADNPAAVAEAAASLGVHATPGDRDQTLLAAAGLWAELTAGQPVDETKVTTVADALALHGYAWEGSRLAGRAATDAADAGEARRLLGVARRLHRNPVQEEDPTPVSAGLTDREVEIGRYVVDGLTYREIGSTLYISPKTVEHHVARIRRKLLAESRAEMIAALRDLLSDA